MLLADRALRLPGGGPDRAFRGLVTPQWLLAWYHLRVTGETDVAGRPAYRVTAIPRRSSRRLADSYDLLDRVDVLAGAGLGIIRRSEQVFDGQVLERAQLHDLVLDPPEAAGPALFALPSDALDSDRPGAGERHGRGWEAAGTAAGVAASAMGFAPRHAPHRAPRRTPGDAELGVLLQHTAFTGERPAVRTELRKLAAAGDRVAGFGADAAPGCAWSPAPGAWARCRTATCPGQFRRPEWRPRSRASGPWPARWPSPAGCRSTGPGASRTLRGGNRYGLTPGQTSELVMLSNTAR